jgi:hypothetical protein
MRTHDLLALDGDDGPSAASQLIGQSSLREKKVTAKPPPLCRPQIAPLQVFTIQHARSLPRICSLTAALSTVIARELHGVETGAGAASHLKYA